MSKIRVMIGLPSGETWKSDFGMCLVALVADFCGAPAGPGLQCMQFLQSEGSILPNLRQHIASQAVAVNATHLLFLDTDQTFPPDTFRRLYSWGKPVVACNVATRKFPSNPTARLKSKTRPAGELVYTTQYDTGLKEVWRIGCGVMLIDLSIFKSLRKPWFPVRWRPDAEMYHGEDWGFCEVLEAHHIPIFIDQELSWQIGHVGKIRYGHDLVLPPKKLVISPGEIPHISQGESQCLAKVAPESTLR